MRVVWRWLWSGPIYGEDVALLVSGALIVWALAKQFG